MFFSWLILLLINFNASTFFNQVWMSCSAFCPITNWVVYFLLSFLARHSIVCLSVSAFLPTACELQTFSVFIAKREIWAWNYKIIWKENEIKILRKVKNLLHIWPCLPKKQTTKNTLKALVTLSSDKKAE